MGERQKQHHGRSEGDERIIAGRDVMGPEQVRDEDIAKADEAREISRAIDENEGYDRQDHRNPHDGGSRGKDVTR